MSQSVRSWTHGQVGLVLAGEEHSATDLLALAQTAENKGFGFAFVSDHFHPWNLNQAHSSYVWSVLGALAVSTERLVLLTAVTCPILRIHPSTLAQAASTIHHLSGGRFLLGLGTGEYLNEHVVGADWLPFSERLARLREAIHCVRELLSGEQVTRQGEFFQLDRAQLFDPAAELEILVASSGPLSAALASELADGLICLGAQADLAESFSTGPADLRPRLTQLSVCWAQDRLHAEKTAHHYFPEVAMAGTLFTKLATPVDFSEAAKDVSVSDVAASIVCGPDPEPYRRAIQECLDAGFDAVALHQIGPDQSGFLNFWDAELRAQFQPPNF